MCSLKSYVLREAPMCVRRCFEGCSAVLVGLFLDSSLCTDEFHNLTVLGEGMFGKVFKAQSRINGRWYAIKQQVLPTLGSANETYLVNEIQSLMETSCNLDIEHVVQLEKIMWSSTHVLLVTGYIEGRDLDVYFFEKKRTSSQQRIDEEIIRVTKLLLLAIAQLHAAGIAHSDIKLANTRITKAGEIKLMDLGFSMLYDPTTVVLHPCGSGGYFSPEIIRGYKRNLFAGDMWALGTCLFLLTTGDYPTKMRNEVLSSTRLMSMRRQQSTAMEQLIVALLNKNATLRPTAQATMTWTNFYMR
jgi:serine/threonine protein kinase